MGQTGKKIIVAKLRTICYNTIMINDAFILLSLANTRLRDGEHTLADVAASLSMAEEALCATLAEIGYRYDESRGQFRPA